jgi:hypothetical protein
MQKKVKKNSIKLKNKTDEKKLLLNKQFVLTIIIFFTALFFIIAFSNPAIFINDEWITANQLYQLDQGHQLTFNEGTYGTYETGETTEYFLYRGNVLQYTIMLPLLSLPVLRFFGLFGDNFRFLVILIWSFIPMLIALLVGTYYPEYGRIKGFRWIWPAIGLSFFLFCANLLFYYQFPFTDIHAPREVAAIVFANHIFFAGMAVVLFSTAKILFKDNWKALLAAFLILVNSSFMFWAANAKDHILVAFCFSLVLFFFVRYYLNFRWTDAGAGFFVIGLLAWARPEIGFTVFVVSFLFFICFLAYRYRMRIICTRTSLLHLVSALMIFPGSIPLLANNYVVAGNPLNPTFILQKTIQGSSGSVAGTTGNFSPAVNQSVAYTVTSPDIAGLIINNYAVNPFKVLIALPQVLFWPESGNMSFIAVCPIAVFALVFICLIISGKIPKEKIHNMGIILFLISMTIAICLTYVTALPLMNTDGGIVPDMRYFSPAYIPVGLLGMCGLYTIIKNSARDLFEKAVIFGIVLTPVFLLTLMVFQPFEGFYRGYSMFYQVQLYLVLILLAIIFILYKRQKLSPQYFKYAVIAVLMVPLSWQLMMLFLYSAGKFNGYPFWIPVVEQIFHMFIRVTIIK